ncbi:hypothetical protein BH09DEP1_BH09DEP1_4870 [soil metagenome]
MNFRTTFFLFSLLSCLPLVSNVKVYHYTTPLSLQLIKDGICTFIDESKDKPDKDVANAIQGILSCAVKNQTNAKETLKKLHNTLNGRIKRIEYQLEHKHLINRKDLAISTLLIAIGIGLTALEYWLYNKWLSPNYKEAKDIKASIEQNGATVTIDTFKTITAKPKPGVTIIPNQAKIFDEQTARLATLYNNNDSKETILLAGGVTTLGAFGIGSLALIASFNPNADNHNLEHYKKLLEIVERFINNSAQSAK